jgi:hypothetical protein
MKSLSLIVLTIGAVGALVTPAMAGPQMLTDEQMGIVIGGDGPNGGIIAGNESPVKVNTRGSVEISGNVQETVKTADVVNSAESSVANGTNVWVSISSPAAFNTNLPDSSIVTQGSTQFPATTLTTVDQQNLVTQDQTRSGSVGGWTRFKANVDNTSKNNTSSNSTASVTKGTTMFKLNPIVEYSSDKGRGAAGAGQANLTVDAGHINIAPELSLETKGSAVFGLFKGEAKTTAKLPISVALPKLGLNIAGAACLADDGATCSATRSDTATNETTETIRSAPTSIMQNANAEIIVGDDSPLEATSVNEVKLLGNAQRDARAVNIVNAASSNVGNGLNFAGNFCCSATQSIVNGPISQRNVFIQAR